MWETKLDKIITIILIVVVAFVSGLCMGRQETKETLEIVEVTDDSILIEYKNGAIHEYLYY